MVYINNKMGDVIAKVHPRTLEILTTKLSLEQRKMVVSDILDAAEKVYFPYQKIVLERNREE